MNQSKLNLQLKVFLGLLSLTVTAHAANFSVQMVANGAGSTNWAYNPTNIVIKVGDTITWTNTHTSQVHDTTYGPRDSGTNGLWTSGGLSATLHTLFPFTFSNAGFYPYRCARHADVVGINYHPEQTGSVSVVSQPLLSQSTITNGQHRMTITVGGAGQTYFVEASTNIADTNAWVPIATNIAPTNTFQFTDPSSVSNFLQRFYRARQ